MKISHEIPKALFNSHFFINDYPYLLAHLLKGKHKDEGYANFYKECVKSHDYSILDNSCYELGESVDPQILMDLIQEYEVTHLVLPDAYKDPIKNLQVFTEFHEMFRGKVKMIGVLQGDSIQEMMFNYDEISSSEVDVIAINFTHLKKDDKTRAHFFDHLLRSRNVEKKIHFLGVQTPFEIQQLTDFHKQYIYSIDTSNPITVGWSYKHYDYESYSKPVEKLADHINKILTTKQLDYIAYNVKMFRQFCS